MRAQKTSEFFAPAAVIELRHTGGGKHRFEGRKEIHDAIIMLAARSKPVELRLLDVNVDIAPGRTHAAAETSLQSNEAGNEAGNENIEIFEFKFNFEKVGKDWLITSVETLNSPKSEGK